MDILVSKVIDVIYAQTVLTKEDLIRLKKKSGRYSTKGALQVAVNHYINCANANNNI